MIARLTTPAILVDLDRVERNLAAMAEHAQAQKVTLRPHTKTHRSIFLSARQRAHGASGLTCAKPAEAAVFVNAGFDDVRIAYSLVDPAQLSQVAQLASSARMSFCVDSVDGARIAERVMAARAARPMEVLLELDTGYGRAGVPWNSEELVEVARCIQRCEHLRLIGVLTHAGESYAVANDGCSDPDLLKRRRREIADTERDRTLHAADAIHSFFETDAPELSIGSTPTATCFENRTATGAGSDDRLAITEIRPGNYIFHDRIQHTLGVATLEQCALTVLLTVVTVRSREDGHHVLLDGGKKVLTSDLSARAGYGMLLDTDLHQPWPGAEIHSLSEEHAWVHIENDERPPQVGDRMLVLPNHSCVVASTANRVYAVRGAEVLHRLQIEARRA